MNRKIIRVRLRLAALTTLHVGGEIGIRSVEAAIARIRGMPYIPSTSVRGVTRSAAYYAAHIAGLPACGVREPEEIEEAHRRLSGGRRHMVCPVCALWGAPGSGFESVLRFTDFVPAKQGVLATARIPHLEIDDYTGRARTGALYFEEVVAPGSMFTGTLYIDGRRLEERVNNGLVINVSNHCLLYKLLAASMLLTPLVGFGRNGIAAIFLESPREIIREMGCLGDNTLEEMVSMLSWHNSRIVELLETVFESLQARIEIVRKSLSRG